MTEVKEAQVQTSSSSDEVMAAPTEVLSTLDREGKRRWITPRLSLGSHWRRRRVIAYVLMIVFVAIPHVRVAGKPAFLIDIIDREITLLGHTFLPSDSILLALFLFCILLSIVTVTAVAGRMWCGWACPQTVYMEFLFRPIDRMFFGTRGKGGRPKKSISSTRSIARIVVYIVLSLVLAHSFLAYFVPTNELAQWVRQSPIENPLTFLVMVMTTMLVLFDFLFFREQMCTLACPYGRLQSVMLDKHSLVVAYDKKRGEPRCKGKRSENSEAGDCVDCHRCVVVCPTGIDIRDGLQMECINCTQCIDACDDVMKKVGLPTGLIRYGSQAEMEGKSKKLLRPRTVIYPSLLAIAFGVLGLVLVLQSSIELRSVRGKGAPYYVESNKIVTNTFQIRIVNRTRKPGRYDMNITHSAPIELEIADRDEIDLDAGQSTVVPIVVSFHPSLTSNDGNERIQLDVSDQYGEHNSLSLRLLGPR